ncbi:MAG: flagellar basal body P-ring formation protein FlgA [Chromatiaceae bacterium]|nr:flagellar basal body P-ring formation protein FlgA [Chromatiaceae bacterium]MCP5447874.1 flagellar basal body P-ring formation protein FlgA [Chromatiaceae bacterium]
MRLPLLICWLSINVIAVATVHAGQYESHERIREAARQHIVAKYSGEKKAEIKILPATLDRRLQLAECAQPLESFSPTSSNNGVRHTVGVRCNGSSNWTLYVTVRVEVSKHILVAKRRLERGGMVAKGDVQVEKRMVSGLHGDYIENPENAIGSRLKLSVKKGAALSPGQLRRPPAVTRGSQVIILGRTGGIEVRMSGRALSDGSKGQRIKVRNNSSSRQVEGTVVASGTVEVTL